MSNIERQIWDHVIDRVWNQIGVQTETEIVNQVMYQTLIIIGDQVKIPIQFKLKSSNLESN